MLLSKIFFCDLLYLVTFSLYAVYRVDARLILWGTGKITDGGRRNAKEEASLTVALPNKWPKGTALGSSHIIRCKKWATNRLNCVNKRCS